MTKSPRCCSGCSAPIPRLSALGPLCRPCEDKKLAPGRAQALQKRRRNEKAIGFEPLATDTTVSDTSGNDDPKVVSSQKQAARKVSDRTMVI